MPGVIKIDGITLASVVDGNIQLNGVGSGTSQTQGTWTPIFTDSSGNDLNPSYSTRRGTYTRMSNLVFFNCYIKITTISGTTDQLYLGGLPNFGFTFSSSNVENNGNPSGTVNYFSSLNGFGAESIYWVMQNSGLLNFWIPNGSNNPTPATFNRNNLGLYATLIFEGKYYLEEIT
tara:strand:- start:390 stop:914 length:525 start_codon:yes stop_codon:yes gene_type:complete